MDPYTQTQVASSGSPVAAFALLFIVVVCYIYISYSLYLMAKKTGVSDPWMAWIPVLSLYILIKTAGKPGWWFFLFLIPIVNIILAFVVWYNAALRLRKPGWLGILVALLPFLLGFLAFGEGSGQIPSAPTVV